MSDTPLEAAARAIEAEMKAARDSGLFHADRAARDARSKRVRGWHVDHIVPHQGDRALFWNTANLQTLCGTHHNIRPALSPPSTWNR